MTKLLVSDDNPNGAKLEDILRILRNDIIARCNVSVETHERETEKVVANNMRILNLLTECIDLAEVSTDILVQAYGVEQAAKGIARLGLTVCLGMARAAPAREALSPRGMRRYRRRYALTPTGSVI